MEPAQLAPLAKHQPEERVHAEAATQDAVLALHQTGLKFAPAAQ